MPIRGVFSKSRTRAPSWPARQAAKIPAAPAPTTTTSNGSLISDPLCPYALMTLLHYRPLGASESGTAAPKA